jgi:hypothetical protein
VDVLATVRRLLAPGGTLIVADERVADTFHAPADATERLFYGYSVLDCLPAGVSKPSAETGTVMRRSTLERYAATAGFSAVSVLSIEHSASTPVIRRQSRNQWLNDRLLVQLVFLASTNGLVPQSLPSEKRKVAGSIPTLAKDVCAGQRLFGGAGRR